MPKLNPGCVSSDGDYIALPAVAGGCCTFLKRGAVVSRSGAVCSKIECALCPSCRATEGCSVLSTAIQSRPWTIHLSVMLAGSRIG